MSNHPNVQHCKYCRQRIVQQHQYDGSPIWIHIESALIHCHAEHACTLKAIPCEYCSHPDDEDLPLGIASH